MQKTIGVLIVGLFIFGGCHQSRGFNPKNSTCDRIQQDLVLMKVSGSNNKYSKEDIDGLNQVINDCRILNSLSKRDYQKYMKLLNEIKDLNSEADHILNTKIHDQRIK